jgi:putative hemolysin
MGVYGVLTQKRNPSGLKWVNRYYVNATDHDEAILMGVALANLEVMIHGENVNFYNVHVWLPNVTPNQKWNQPLNLEGGLSISAAMKPEIVARYYFSVDGSQNPHFKDYRVQIESTSLAGYNWASGFLTAASSFSTGMTNSSVNFCTRQGNDIFPSHMSNEYEFRQLSKAWYNRPSA